MSKAALSLRKLLTKLKPYGIITMTRKRGKGSEIILLKPSGEGSKQGSQFPIKNHGDATEISIPAINAILRRFRIDKNEFWD